MFLAEAFSYTAAILNERIGHDEILSHINAGFANGGNGARFQHEHNPESRMVVTRHLTKDNTIRATRIDSGVPKPHKSFPNTEDGLRQTAAHIHSHGMKPFQKTNECVEDHFEWLQCF